MLTHNCIVVTSNSMNLPVTQTDRARSDSHEMTRVLNAAGNNGCWVRFDGHWMVGHRPCLGNHQDVKTFLVDNNNNNNK